MKIALAIILLLQANDIDAKKLAGASIILDGVATVRSFELKHEYKDLAAKRIADLKSSSISDSKKRILIEETKSLQAETEKTIEKKWTMPVIDFEKATTGAGGVLASSSITVVDSSASKMLALKPVFVEWNVLDIEDGSTMVVNGSTGYERGIAVDGKLKINIIKVRIRDYPTRRLTEGATIKIETLAFCTGVETHLDDQILAFKLFSRADHDMLIRRGQRDGKRLFDDMQESFDKMILQTK